MVVNQRLCKYKSWASFFAPLGISILSVVFMRFLKPILPKRLFSQDDESRSMWSNIRCGFLAIRALATDTAVTEVIKPPLLRRANKNFCITWSEIPYKSGRPRGKTFRLSVIGRFSFLAFSSSALYMAQNSLTALLLTGRLFDPNAAAAGSLQDLFWISKEKVKIKDVLLSIKFLSRSLPATDVCKPWELLPWLCDIICREI